MREGRKELASAYKKTLAGVPQDPTHHPEGDVLNHVRLVRKAIPGAIQQLQVAQTTEGGPLQDILSNMNFSLTPKQEQIIALSAWLHDIGKATATTIGGEPWQTAAPGGRIQAIGHQDYQHYRPQLEKLKQFAPPETIELYLQNEPLVNWLIEHHMDFASGQGFSKRFVAENFDGHRVQDTLRMRLLLILMWADKMGRRPEDTILTALGKNVKNLQLSSERGAQRFQRMTNQSSTFQGGPEEFAQLLKQRQMAANQRIAAMRGKFPQLSPEEIQQYLQEGFRCFMESVEPVRMDAEIPMPPEVYVLDDALRLGGKDRSVVLLAVGGAVRDYLYHQFHGGKGGFKPKDTDLTTNLSEEQILERLRTPYAASKGIKVAEKESVDTFGVVFAHVGKGGEVLEIAPFRKDIGSVDGRRPERVEQAEIHEDAMRRDLTMNNLYYDFHNKQILDYNPGGQGIQDVKNGVARPVGNPFERFDEDKLRVLRLVRFFCRFNPGSIVEKLDPETRAAIDHFKDLSSFGITPERIQMEFLAGIKQSMNTAQFLQSYADLGLFNAVFPGMKVDIAGIHSLQNTKNPKIVLAWLLRGNKDILNKLNALKYSNELAKPVQFLVDTLNFGAESAFELIKRRDQQFLGRKAYGPGGVPLNPQEIEVQNKQIAVTMSQDLAELARLTGNQQIMSTLQHLGGKWHPEEDRWHHEPYKPPAVNSQELMQQGFKGAALGDEIKRRTTSHYQQSLQDFLGRGAFALD